MLSNNCALVGPFCPEQVLSNVTERKRPFSLITMQLSVSVE
jgi:hypothetical protein